MTRASFAALCFALSVVSCSSEPSDEQETPGADEPSPNMKEASAAGLRMMADRGVELQTVDKSPDEVLKIGYGSYLANAGVCDVCHVSTDGTAYAGGVPFAVDLEGNQVLGKNLTPDARTGMKLSEAQFVETMRTGKDFSVPEDQAPQQLVVFPWYDYRWLTLADLSAIYAFLRALPPVESEVPPAQKGAFFAAFTPVAFPARFDQGEEDRDLSPEDADVDGVSRGASISPLAGELMDAGSTEKQRWSIARGSYLVNTLGHCSDCHTNPSRDFEQNSPRYLRIGTENFLSGGFAFPVFPAALTKQIRTMSSNLTGAEHGFLNAASDSEQRFLDTIDSGMKLDGPGAPRLLGWPMPWDNFRLMTRADLVAIYDYLKTIPPRLHAADKQTQTVARYCEADSDCLGEGERCELASSECAGTSCAALADCGACQSCSDAACVAPAADDACFFHGL